MNTEHRQQVKALGENFKNKDLTLSEYRKQVIALDRHYRDDAILTAKQKHDKKPA